MLSTKIKDPSPLVLAVLALDEHFTEISRLSQRVAGTELKSDADFEQMQRLMQLFAECGQGISDRVQSLSVALNEARDQAEEAAKIVGARAEDWQGKQLERQKKLDLFRSLGEKVQGLTASLQDLRKPEGESATEEDRARIARRLQELEGQLQPLITEADALKTEAQDARMRGLEKDAHSLSQSLSAMTTKLAALQQTSQVLQ